MEALDPRHRAAESRESGNSRVLHRRPTHIPRNPSWGSPISSSSKQMTSGRTSVASEVFDAVDRDPRTNNSVTTGSGGKGAWSNLAAIGLAFTSEASGVQLCPPTSPLSVDDTALVDGQVNRADRKGPFSKWVKTIQQRANGPRRNTVSNSNEYIRLTDQILNRRIQAVGEQEGRSDHKKSLSDSSLGFVTTIKSASVSLASFSVAPRSRRTGVSVRYQNHSSRTSNGGDRLSGDSSYVAGSVVDDKDVIDRSIQRRKVLEEIVNTEESYVADMKFLLSVCRSSIQENNTYLVFRYTEHSSRRCRLYPNR